MGSCQIVLLFLSGLLLEGQPATKPSVECADLSATLVLNLTVAPLPDHLPFHFRLTGTMMNRSSKTIGVRPYFIFRTTHWEITPRLPGPLGAGGKSLRPYPIHRPMPEVKWLRPGAALAEQEEWSPPDGSSDLAGRTLTFKIEYANAWPEGWIRRRAPAGCVSSNSVVLELPAQAGSRESEHPSDSALSSRLLSARKRAVGPISDLARLTSARHNARSLVRGFMLIGGMTGASRPTRPLDRDGSTSSEIGVPRATGELTAMLAPIAFGRRGHPEQRGR